MIFKCFFTVVNIFTVVSTSLGISTYIQNILPSKLQNIVEKLFCFIVIKKNFLNKYLYLSKYN